MADQQKIGPTRAPRPEPTGEAQYLIPDGVPRTYQGEQDLNILLSTWLNRPEADQCITYLKTLSINRVHGPEALDEKKLLHKEGASWLVWLMEIRAAYGRSGLPKTPPQ